MKRLASWSPRFAVPCHLATLLALVGATACAGPGGAAHSTPRPAAPAAALELEALQHFSTIEVPGFLPYYRDKKNRCLAIDAAVHKSGFAAARATFTGAPGTYDLTLTALAESDGESTYRVLVNGKPLGERQNPAVDAAGDYSEVPHRWTAVSLATGDLLQIESNPHSNGKIPEDDAFAFSRGRWRKLSFAARPAP